MKKQTQIINLLHTADFVVESNKDGKKIDLNDAGLFAIVPSRSLGRTISSLGGQAVTNAFNTQLFLPFDFKPGVVDNTIANQLPAELVFYIECFHPELLAYTGLSFNQAKLFLTPGGSAADYTLYGRSIHCKSCSSGVLVSQADSIKFIYQDITPEEIRHLTGSPVGTGSQMLDLKVTVRGVECIITRHEDMNQLHNVLKGFSSMAVPLSVKRNSTNAPIGSFNNILVLGERLPSHYIGVIKIPFSALVLSMTDAAAFPAANNYIVHFPGIRTTLALEISTRQFEAGSTLFINETEIAAPDVQDHPDMPGYKLVKATVNNYTLFHRNAKQVSIRKDKKSKVMPIDPVKSYNSQLNHAKILITK